MSIGLETLDPPWPPRDDPRHRLAMVSDIQRGTFLLHAAQDGAEVGLELSHSNSLDHGYIVTTL